MPQIETVLLTAPNWAMNIPLMLFTKNELAFNSNYLQDVEETTPHRDLQKEVLLGNDFGVTEGHKHDASEKARERTK